MKQFAAALLLMLVVTSCSKPVETSNAPKAKTYAELEILFKEWREFQRPPLKEGTPDYSLATMKKQPATNTSRDSTRPYQYLSCMETSKKKMGKKINSTATSK